MYPNSLIFLTYMTWPILIPIYTFIRLNIELTPFIYKSSSPLFLWGNPQFVFLRLRLSFFTHYPHPTQNIFFFYFFISNSLPKWNFTFIIFCSFTYQTCFQLCIKAKAPPVKNSSSNSKSVSFVQNTHNVINRNLHFRPTYLTSKLRKDWRKKT